MSILLEKAQSAVDKAQSGRFSYYQHWDPEITPDKADELARGYAEKGVNALIINHHHFRWTYVDLFSSIEHFTGTLVEACHRHGLLAIEHHSSTAASGSCSYKGKQVSDWANRDVRTGEVGAIPIRHDGELYNAWWCCLNNPEWQESYYDYISRFFATTGVDGLQHDDIHFAPGWMYCGCEHCRKKFRGIFGYDLPRGADHPAWEDFESQTWRDWLMFRRISAGDEFVRMSKVLGPEKILFGCCSTALNTTLGVHDAGYCYEDFARGANVLYEEDIYHSRNEQCKGHHFNNYKRHVLDRKYYAAMSEKSGKPCIVYCYPASGEEDFFCWSLAKSFAQAYCRRDQWSSVTSVCHAWEKRYEDLLRSTGQLANIGLLHSATTMTFAGADSQYYLDELRGWAQAMTEENIPFRVVVADAHFGKQSIKDLDLLILPNVRCLGELQISVILDYVRNGGNLILTHETSICDENGAIRETFGLRELLGFDYRRTVQGINLPVYPANQGPENAIMSGTLDRIPYHGPHTICTQPQDISDIAAWIEKYNQFAPACPDPAVIKGRYGQGRFVYFSFKPGLMSATEGPCSPITKDYSQQFVAQLGCAKPLLWVDERVPAHKTIILNALRSLIAEDSLPYTVLSCPSGVLINAYSSGDQVVFALLNISGVDVVDGQKLDLEAAVRYPRIDGDVEIRLNRVFAGEVYLTSPDRQGMQQLEFRLSEQGTIFVVPAGYIERFSLVAVTQEVGEARGRL